MLDSYFETKFLPAIHHPASYEMVDGRHTKVSDPWTEYPVNPGWDFNAFTRDVRMAGVPKTSGSVTRAGAALRSSR